MRVETQSKANYASRQMERQNATERPGFAKSRKVRVVCRPCNNGWMGRVEEEVKPILSPMIKGETVLLDRRKQESLARWLSLKLLVCDHIAGSPVIHLDARKAFMQNRQPLGDMKIWISRCNAQWAQSAFARQTAAIQIKPIEKGGGHPAQNLQTVTLGVGNAFFYIYHNLSPIKLNINFNQGGAFSQIWPAVEDIIFWPPLRSLTAAEAVGVSKTLLKILDDPRVEIISD